MIFLTDEVISGGESRHNANAGVRPTEAQSANVQSTGWMSR